MTPEERKRRLQAYALQNFTGPLNVEKTINKPTVTVEKPQPQRLKVSVQPNLQVQPKLRVSTPFTKSNFSNEKRSTYLGPVVQPIKTFGTEYAKGLAGGALRAERGAVGFAEGMSGSYDLLTPGLGTNRVTQTLNRTGAKLDTAAKNIGGNAQFVYKAGEVPTEIALIAGTGGLAGTTSLAAKAGKFGKFGKVVNTIDKNIEKVGSKFGRFGKNIANLSKTKDIATEGIITSKYIGEDVSKGREITPQRVAIDYGTGVIGNIATAGIGPLINRIKYARNKRLNKEITDEITDNIDIDLKTYLKREFNNLTDNEIDEVAGKILKDPDNAENIIQEVVTGKIEIAPKQIAKPTPNVPTPDSNTAIIKAVKTTKDPNQIRDAVAGLFPTLPKQEADVIITKLAKSTDDKEIQTILKQAQTRHEELSKSVEQAVPVGEPVGKPTPLEQAVEDGAVQAPPSETIQSAPKVEEPTTTTPTAVTDAITPEAVPGAQQTTAQGIVGQKLSKTTDDINDNTISVDEMNSILDSYKKRFGKEDGLYFKEGENDVKGTYSPSTKNIELNTNYPDGITATYDHESIHKVIYEYLTTDDIASLLKDVVRINGGKRGLVNKYKELRYENIDWKGAAEEEVANLFNDFLNNGIVWGKVDDIKKSIYDWTLKNNVSPKIVSLFLKLARVFDDIIGRNGSKQRLAEFYKRVDSGEYSNVPTIQRYLDDENIKYSDVTNRYSLKEPTQTPVETTVQNIVDANEQIANTYNKGAFGKIKDFVRTQWDPRAEANRLDKEYEKTIGRKLTADEKLGEAIRASGNSKNTSAQFIKDSPEYTNVIKKYRPNTQAGQEFNYYRMAMLDLERRANGRQPLTDYSTEQLLNDTAQLEAKYPGIRNDLIALSQGYVRRLQELAVNGPDAFISADDFARVALKKDGTPYNYYTPIMRKMPENVARPEITAKNVGNISRQQVLQDLEKTGNDVDLTYDSLERYSDVVHKQLGQAKVARILGQRVEKGIGGKFIQTADEFARIKTYRQNLKELRDVSKSLDKTIGKLKTKAAYGSKDVKQATKQATTRAKQLLKQTISDDPDARAAIDSLSDADLIDVLKLAAEPDIRNTPNVRRIYNRFAKKSAALARVVEDLDYARMDAEALESAENGIRSEIAELAPDPTTGKQIIRGLDSEGNRFTIEVPPEMAKLLQGLEWKGGNITRVGRTLTAPLRMAWTGILNPAFIAKSAIWNAAMVPITSPRGFKIYAPSAIKAGFSAINNNSDFQKMLTRNAANRYGSDFNKLNSDSITDAIAGNADIASRMRFYNPFTPKGFARNWAKLNEIGGKIDAMYRSAAAKAEYDYVIKNGGTVQQAQKAASEAYSTVLPDYGNVSQQIKALDAWVPYTAASTAGTRTFFRAVKNDPLKNAAILSAYTSIGVGIAAYSMSHDNGKEFYEDMAKSGKLPALDGYAVVVLPGAHKDDTTGEWNGVVKIPVPPELRAVNRAIRETMATIATEKDVDPKMYAKSVFDFMTGGALTQPKAPVFDIGASMLSGTNVTTGAPIREPNATRGEAILQNYDYLADQFGIVGKTSKEVFGRNDKENKDKQTNVGTILADSFKTIFYGAKGEKDSQKYFRYKKEALDEVKLNSNQLGVFNSVISPRSKDLEGKDIKDKSFYDQSAKAQAWLKDITAGDGKLWEVSKKIAQKQKAEGKPIDPLYELSGDKLKTVLGLMANPSPGNAEEKAIQDLNPWVKDFYSKRSDYYDTIFGGESSKDYNGVSVPKADKQLQAKIDGLDAMDKAQKAQFIKDNPDITDYFTAQTAYQRYKRDIMGLPQFDQYPNATPEVQRYMDIYNSLPKDNGPLKKDGTPSSPERSAWIKAHPKEWEQMTEQWFKQNVYSLQGAAALAQYEGLSLNEDDFDKMANIVKQMGGQQPGFGFGYGGKKEKTLEEKMSPNLAQFIRGINVSDLNQPKIIDPTPTRVKFKVKLPSSSKGRSYKKIRLQ